SGVLLYTFAPQPRHALSRQRRAFLAAVAGLCALLLERDALRREVVLRRREAEAAAAGRREAIEARDLALSTAAHELRSPLTAVSGYAQLLLRACQEPRVTGQAMPGTHGEDSSRVEGVLRQIVDRTRVMKRLVLELLDTARRAWGTMELHKEPADVAQLVRCVAGAPREGVPAGRVVVRTPAGAVRAVVDPVRLEQVLHNLVDNALKYSPAGTPVEVRLATPRRQTLRLTVRDYGPGVPPAQRERIFEPFYRVEGTSRAGGLGLGLAVCRDIVAAHQGAIAVQNPTGGGARFCVTLPRGLDPAGERPARATGRA
ncbi:MAG TPA: ATP-binding protein, partial [Chloroflexota bacterium]|nr:ATP-binding protein [Chloroflexota bacterium]